MREGALAVALALALVAGALVGVLRGVPNLAPGEAVAAAVGAGASPLATIVVRELRLPRIALALLAGVALSLAGTILQDTLRNPLAGPELLGVSAGAAVVMAVLLVFVVPISPLLYPWFALGGGLAGGAIVLGAVTRQAQPSQLILVGAALSALLNAGIYAVVALGAQYHTNILYLYLLGSLANHTWAEVRLVAPWLALAVPLALGIGRVLNLVKLGDEVSGGLGLPIARIRPLLLLLSAALVAPVVAVAGPIGWVALLAPHLARRLLGTGDARRVLPLAAALGAAILLLADQLARLAFAPIEVPVGVWTALLAGPLLLALLRREGRAER